MRALLKIACACESAERAAAGAPFMGPSPFFLERPVAPPPPPLLSALSAFAARVCAPRKSTPRLSTRPRPAAAAARLARATTLPGHPPTPHPTHPHTHFRLALQATPHATTHTHTHLATRARAIPRSHTHVHAHTCTHSSFYAQSNQQPGTSRMARSALCRLRLLLAARGGQGAPPFSFGVRLCGPKKTKVKHMLDQPQHNFRRPEHSMLFLTHVEQILCTHTKKSPRAERARRPPRPSRPKKPAVANQAPASPPQSSSRSLARRSSVIIIVSKPGALVPPFSPSITTAPLSRPVCQNSS